MPNLRGKTWTTTTPANVEDAQYWEDHLISNEAAQKAAGAVQSVNNTLPDENGNINITPSPLGPTVVDSLNSTSATDALSANQGHALKGLVDAKQNTLTFDNVPTNGSDNPVKSGGIYDALAPKVSEVLLKDTVGWVGKNEFDTSNITSGASLATINSDASSIKIKSETAGTYKNTAFQMKATANKDYIFVCDADYTSGVGFVRIEDANGNALATSSQITADGNVRLTFNSGNNTTLNVKLFCTMATSETGEVDFNDAMLYKASITDSTFEPYHKSVEEWGYTREEAKANGAYNLMPINAKSGTVHGATLTVSDSGVTYVGTTSETGWIWLNSATNSDTPNILMKKGTYKFSLGGAISDSPIFNINDGAGGNTYFNGRSSDEIEITFANDTYIRYGLYAGSANVSVNISIKPMISIEGGDYVPYAMTNRELTDAVTPDSETITIPLSESENLNLQFTKLLDNVVFVNANNTTTSSGLSTSWVEKANIIPAKFRPKTTKRYFDMHINDAFFKMQIDTNGTLKYMCTSSGSVYIQGSTVYNL